MYSTFFNSFFRLSQPEQQDYPKLLYIPHHDYNDPMKHLKARNRKYHVLYLLRHPVRRVFSEFKHVIIGKHKAWDYHIDQTKYQNNLTESAFLEFLENPAHYYGVYNRQARMTAGFGCCWKYVEVDGKKVQIIDEEKLLEKAKNHIDRSIYTGIFEELEKSLDLLAYTFGVHPSLLDVGKLTHREKTDRTVLDLEISDAMEEKILELNRVDLALYEHCLTLFHERLKDATDSVELERQRWIRDHKTSSLPINVFVPIHFDDEEF